MSTRVRGRYFHPILCVLPFVLGLAGGAVAQEGDGSFRPVRMILMDHCVRCHGEVKQKGNLRLDTRDHALRGGESGKPILGGTLENNELYLRVSTDDPDLLMPPEGGRLSDEEVQTIRRWVEQGAHWPPMPDEASEGRWANGWRYYDAYAEYFDRYARPILVPLVLALAWVWVSERCRVAQRTKPRSGVVAFIARTPRLVYPLVLLAIVGAAFLHDSIKARDVLRRLEARGPVVVSSFTPQSLYGTPPMPFRPPQPKRLGGEYYRGNCERNSALFNGGNYRTATFRLSLHDMAGHKLSIGDPVPPGGLLVRLEIERGPQATPSLFSDAIMSKTALRHSTRGRPEEEPAPLTVWLQPVEPDERWAAFYPIPSEPEQGQPMLSGLVYLLSGANPENKDGTSGEPHYGIKYDLVLHEGALAEGSDMWVGNIFWHTGIALPPDPNKVPFEQWFSSNPDDIPPITGPNTTDPKLLGIEEHEGALKE